jgi:nitrite reductase/ring-hydroxylating ferredoxin subunit
MPEILRIQLSELVNLQISKRAVGGKEILLYRSGNDVSAIASRCSHLNLALPAKAVNGVITCGFHGAQFDAKTGTCLVGALGKDWQKSTPLGVGALAAALIPKKNSPDLEKFVVEIIGDNVSVTV